ncbi:hypothetical protein [Nesterenkonia marinintestina]|uniref:hypothetical protein n=1 Tax=Nesterenkonia marinintestina TaxID=2979865 RepID=UPI0021BFA9DA|nr:hypothetical protein [Nesterenkonia sp. GX14115]
MSDVRHRSGQRTCALGPFVRRGALCLGLAALLLSGCGLFDPEEESGSDPDDGTQSPTAADDAAEEADDDGESGGDDADDAEGAVDGSEASEDLTAGLAEGEAPELAEIEDHLWETMLEAESVTISGTSPLGDSQLDDYFAEVVEDVDEDTPAELSVAGTLDGSASESHIRIGEDLDLTVITVGGRTYLKGEDFAHITALSSSHENAEFVDQSVIDEVLAGRWIDLGSAEEMASLSPQSLLEQWRDTLFEDVEDITGEAEQQDGEEVWVYTSADGGTTYVVSADDEPHLVGVDDGDTSLTLTDWDETEPVEAPEDSLTMDEVTQALIDSAPLPRETAEP